MMYANVMMTSSPEVIPFGIANIVMGGFVPVMALRISVAAASLISSEACSLYHAVWGVQIRLGASFRGPWEKLREHQRTRKTELD